MRRTAVAIAALTTLAVSGVQFVFVFDEHDICCRRQVRLALVRRVRCPAP